MLRHRLSLREDGDIIPFAQISVTVISNILMSDRRIKICKLVDVSIFKNQTLFHLPIYVCMYGWRPSLSTLYHRWTRTWLNYSHVHELQLKLGKTPTLINLLYCMFLYRLLQPHCSMFVICTRKVSAVSYLTFSL